MILSAYMSINSVYKFQFSPQASQYLILSALENVNHFGGCEMETLKYSIQLHIGHLLCAEIWLAFPKMQEMN